MHAYDFSLEERTLRQLSWAYYKNNRSFPTDLHLLDTDTNAFYHDNQTRLQDTVLNNFRIPAEPFNYYQDYQSLVQELVDSGHSNRNHIRDVLSSDQKRLSLDEYEVNAIIDNVIKQTIVVRPTSGTEPPKPPFIQIVIQTVIQTVKKIYQRFCNDKYLQYILLAIIVVFIILLWNVRPKPDKEPVPITSPSPFTSPTSSLGMITDGLEGMPTIDNTKLEKLINDNNAIAKDHPGKYRTIVASVPITGGNSLNNATEILRGISLAQDKQNQQKKPKFYLFLKVADDSNDKQIAEKLATQFVEDSEILGVIGHNSSAASIQAASKYKDNLAMISPTSTADNLTKDNSGYIYRVVQTDSDLARRLARYLKEPELNFTNFYLCVAEDDKNKNEWATNAKSFADAFVGEMKERATFDKECSLPPSKTEDVDVSSQVSLVKQKLSSNNYNSLLLVASTSTKFASWELAQIFKNSIFSEKGLFGNDALYTDVSDKVLQASFDGMNNKLTLVAPWHKEDSNQYVQNYVKAYKKQFPSESDGLNWRSAMSYDSTIALIKALDTLDFSSDQEIQKNRKAVAKALKKIVIPAEESATGEVRFTPKGDRDISVAPNLGGYIVRAKKVQAEDGNDSIIYTCIDGCDLSAAPKTEPQ